MAGPSCLGSKCSSETDDSEIEDRGSAVVTSGRGLPSEGSDCSEEEVFEGYVDEDSIRGGRGQWEEPTDVVTHEVPAHVLTELKSVLTVRNHERERKRMHRHGHHGGAWPASCDPPIKSCDKGGDGSHDQQLGTPGNKGVEPTSCDKDGSDDDQDPTIPDNCQKGVEPVSCDSPMESCDKEDISCAIPSVPGDLKLDQPLPPTGHSPISLSAEMAAAIRGRKFRNTEDIFS